MKRILAAIHDPGGASGLIPVLQELQTNKGVALTLYAGKFVEARVQAAGLAFKALPSDLSPAAAAALFGQHSPSALLTGTSWGSLAEQHLRNEAHAKKISSIVFMDYWSNYSKRWEGATYSIRQLSDVVAILDEGMRDEMLSEGFPEKSLMVTGHPRLEALSRESPGSAKNGKSLFLSEPPRSSYNGPASGHPLLKLAETFAAMNKRGGISVKLHPKEELTADLQGLIEAVNKMGIPSAIVSDLVLPQGFKNFEYVFGYQSMGLFEAASIGAKAFAFPSAPPGRGLAAALERFGIARLSDPASIQSAVEKTDQQSKNVGTLVQGAGQAIQALVLA